MAKYNGSYMSNGGPSSLSLNQSCNRQSVKCELLSLFVHISEESLGDDRNGIINSLSY